MRIGIIAAGIVASIACTSPASSQRSVPPRALDPSNVARGMGQLADMIAKGVFQQADVNRDGALTRSEAAHAGSQFGVPIGTDPRAFAAMDLNKDGVIAQREMADAIRFVQARTSMGQKPF